MKDGGSSIITLLRLNTRAFNPEIDCCGVFLRVRLPVETVCRDDEFQEIDLQQFYSQQFVNENPVAEASALQYLKGYGPHPNIIEVTEVVLIVERT